ncbi:Flagellar biosynthetic protein FlhB [Posidoniimonas polymericola]|uniref:Flagellar biosynthetic protein FlhB n=1 Tax=Posidoniimonas polymericola TaxID=2528002 RepID=A0A5C5YQM5_9BACT|nr:flagellar biosynthesis protein FlhB [Posidoniimonas polymericola]TWT77234.1 Flagellar biosynthetic protein FlhB [Posidoniimonas polymericola]
MAEQSGDKTFDATPHRRQQAREKGQVAYSQDLGSAALLVAAALIMMSLGGRVAEAAAKMLHRQLGEVGVLHANPQAMIDQSMEIGAAIGMTLLPVFGLLMLSSIASSVFQTGLLFVPNRLAPDLSRLSLLQGVKRILSLQGVMRLGFGMFKVAIVSTVSTAVVLARSEEILNAGALSIGGLAILTGDVVTQSLLWVGIALLVLALADFAFQKWKHEQDLKMTHQEVKEEMKNLQGDPQVIARRKQVQRQMALNRMGQEVPQADVVVTNPTELAVALRYDPDRMAAPIVVAKGAGVIAQRIRRLALENNVPIVERKPLAQLLYKEVKLNHPVPDNSYAAVAEVLAYVYQLKGKKAPQPRAA